MDLETLIIPFRHSPRPVLVHDGCGQITFANVAFYQASGWLVGQPVEVSEFPQLQSHLLCVVKDSADSRQCVVKNIKTAVNQSFEAIGYRQPLVGGKDVYVTHLVAETSTQKTAATDVGVQDLTKKSLILTALNSVTETLLKQQPLDQLLQSIAEHLIELTGASSTYVHLVKHEKECLELVACAGEYVAPLGQTLAPGIGLAGQVFKTGEAAYVEDYSSYKFRLPELVNITQAAALPMSTYGEVQGVLGLLYSSDEESIAESLDVLQQFTNLASVALHNAQLTNEMQNELAHTNSLVATAKKITACETLPRLCEVAAACLIERFGIQLVEFWKLQGAQLDSSLGAWKQLNGDVCVLSVDELSASEIAVGQWIEQTIENFTSFTSLGYLSLSHFELSSGDDPDIHTFGFIEEGEFWGLLRLRTDNHPDVIRTLSVVRSVISHISVAARLIRMLDKAKYRAGHDDLTGLANKFTLNSYLEDCLNNLMEHKGRLCIVYFDLDGFKEINDTLGHLQGDVVLETVARRVDALLDGEYMFARLGGDEFAAVGWFSDLAACECFANRILNVIAEPVELDGSMVLSASIGVAMHDEGVISASELINIADQAMYESKRRGKNQFCITPSSRFKLSANDESLAPRKVG